MTIREMIDIQYPNSKIVITSGECLDTALGKVIAQIKFNGVTHDIYTNCGCQYYLTHVDVVWIHQRIKPEPPPDVLTIFTGGAK